MQIMWTETEARNRPTLSHTGPKEHDSNKAAISRLTTRQKVNYYRPWIVNDEFNSDMYIIIR